MRRSRLEALLHDYVAGDLGEAERRDVERKLETDPTARSLYEEVRSAHDALSLLRERPEPPVAARDVFPGIQAAIAASAFEPRPRLALEGLGTRYYRRIAIAATLLFALTVGYISLAGRGEGTPVDTRPPQPVVERRATPIELGTRREGISAAEFIRLLEETRNLDDLQVEMVPNVVEIAEWR